MTKAELADAVQLRLGGSCSQREAVDLVESVLGILKESLSQGDHVKLSSFGTFALQDKAPRIGRNPQTGEPTMIEARRVVKFKVSAKLRGRMNTGSSE